MATGKYRVYLRAQASEAQANTAQENDEPNPSMVVLDAGSFGFQAASLSEVTQDAAAQHFRANRASLGYEVNQDEGMVYMGSHAVPVTRFIGYEVRLISKSRN